MDWSQVASVVGGWLLRPLWARREARRQQQAVVRDLVAECQDNVQSMRDAANTTARLACDKWTAHTGRLHFLPPSLVEDLRAVYADIGAINSLVGQLQGGSPGATMLKSNLKTGKEKLAPELEAVAHTLANRQTWPDS